MKRTDYLLAITSGFLKSPEKQLPVLQEHFSKRIEMSELAKPGTVSLGGRDTNGKEGSFLNWVSSLRNKGIQEVRLGYIQQDIQGMAAHMSAGFAGMQDLFLQVITNSGAYTFDIQTIYSPQNEISPEEFIELIDSQPKKEKLWNRIYELIKESNEMNNRVAPPADKIKEYFLTLDNSADFDFHLSQVFPEIQVECKIMNSDLQIPPALSHVFQKSQYSFDEFDSDKDHIYFYPVKEVTAEELLSLVNKQSFKEEIWKGLSEEFAQYPDPEIPAVSSLEWPTAIQQMGDAPLQTVVGTVCRVICRLCEGHNLKPVVPDSLKDSFGPDELENKRAQARSRLNKDQWFLTPNQNPWEMYFLESIPDAGEIKKADPAKEKVAFSKALQKAAQFATHIQSPFAEAFLLSEYLLSKDVPKGNFDEQHLNTLLADLRKNNFSDMALENFQHSFYYSEDFSVLGWPADRIFSAMAISISDVFGGMGSWNDQYMDNEEDQKAYDKVSSDLFNTLKDFTAAVLAE